jgi:acyl-CoA reductase-like NAD-dependent aldehyde dehydrogenase
MCVALKRLYVHEAVYEQVCAELAVLANRAVVGDGLAAGTQFGPLQNRHQFEKVKELIAASRSCGKIIAGGEVPYKTGYFIRPTIVRDIEDGARLVDEEQFGPVLPVIRFSDVEDALARANTSPFGLGQSIWSSDLEKAEALAMRSDAGTVWINKHPDMAPHIPFGGAKQSGIGTELGAQGLLEFTRIHVINSAR